ncbi:HTTM domain-containing protein [Tenacibaculum singaporense]|uniref:HTTM domain-containing protein n=1 Tax=Tenacibaculum singaporense TaxID=2358479 RepID=A0A3S8R6V8_9FLAO|nr:HTTM domain-containing protein [Tenacibaculum singaporense]AZJ35511.1 HTTM domain-containing protein [Tenacibaculum singaporense]
MISKNYLSKQINSAPLAVFRVFFGIMMLFGIIRFWYHGWIEKLYVQPTFHFSYYGFEWVKPIGNYTYLLFVISGLSAAFVALGFKYRLAIVTFFLSFTYIELMDKTTYLNHYYFISILSFVLIFLPANARFSLDAYLRKREYINVPKWTIDSVKLLLGIVYFYAGLAKLNSDWLFRAQPLKIWLPSKYDLPFIGNNLMQQEWFHYAMSWSGALYDLSIPFLLLYKRTRLLAFGLVVFFHVFTRVLFPIGMFPFIMIVATLIFFDASLHEKIIQFIKRVFSISSETVEEVKDYTYTKLKKKVILSILGTLFVLQILLPWRYLLYPGELFWTEEGFRFSWRVMLIEKAGYANFKIVDGETGKFFYVNNADFLTSFQEKQMSFQPDFILEYAHYLGDHFKKDGHKNIEVYVESFVALNGRLSQPYINSKVDLYKQKESFKHKDWILPFTDKIKIYGL